VKPLWVFEFQIVILHLQLVQNFNCKLKGGVRSYLLNTFIILIKPIVLMYSVLSMEGRQNMWSPWCLMLEDKLGKMYCNFCGNVIPYCKDRMLFYLGYRYDGNA